MEGGSGEVGMVSQLLPGLNYDSFPNQNKQIHNKMAKVERTVHCTSVSLNYEWQQKLTKHTFLKHSSTNENIIK